VFLGSSFVNTPSSVFVVSQLLHLCLGSTVPSYFSRSEQECRVGGYSNCKAKLSRAKPKHLMYNLEAIRLRLGSVVLGSKDVLSIMLGIHRHSAEASV
jgi:hypothetical protein